MNKTELQTLTQKYLDGTATPEEKRLLDQWYDGTINSGWAETVELNAAETEADVKQRILGNLHKELFAAPKVTPAKRNAGLVKRLSIWVGSAAAVLALAFFVWMKYSDGDSAALFAEKQIVSVPMNRVMHITLPDSSKVWLNAGSVFKYPKNFKGKNRVVELVEGRAFFDIKHQTEHPFIVKAKNLNITVLGTSFDVRSYKKEGLTKVSVVTGKVGITMNGKSDIGAIMLLPKQEIVLINQTKEVTKGITHEAVVNAWCNVFEQESLANVFKAIEKEYHTKITVEDKLLLDEKITIKLDNQHLDTIMQILSYTKHFKYQMANDSTVIIK